jgi:hypothetical protein
MASEATGMAAGIRAATGEISPIRAYHIVENKILS